MKRLLAILATISMLAVVGAAGAQEPQQNDQQAQQAPTDYSTAPQADGQVDQTAGQTDDQADSQDIDTEQQDAAAQPGVARVSSITGDVSTQRGDNGEWVAATLNTPISQGDRLATGEKSRAELQLDFADTLRMSDRATVKIANLTRTQIHLQIGQGLTTYTVNSGAEAATEIDTPNAAIRPGSGGGEYRILVNSDAETQVIVRRGSAEIATPQGSTRVDAGQMITIAGTDNAQYKVSQAPPPDGWDGWNNDRNNAVTSAGSWQKTNRYYVGTEDLDPYGRWTTVPEYGQVWVPSVSSNWAPYRAGRWVWQPYYGWTWVSYEPWGWAPYHYGRWFVYGNGWAWWPGPVATYPAYYPVWAPAYVSFFGFGGGGFGVSFGIGFGFGHVGWLPTGPCDWYHPWYGRYGGRVNVVNVTNIHNTTIINNHHSGWGPLRNGGSHQYSNINEAFRNQRVRAGITSMDGKNFGRGAVPSHQSGVSESQFRQARMVAGRMPVQPSKASYSPTDRKVNPATIRGAAPSSQRFFSAPRTTSAGTAQAGRFSGRTATANSNQRTGYSSTARSAQRNIGGYQNFGAANQTRTSPSTNGTNRAGTPTPVTSTRPGWRTFTPPQQSSRANGQEMNNGQSNTRGNSGNSANRGTFNAPASLPGASQNNSRGSSQNAPQNNRHQNSATNSGGWQHYTPPPRGSQPQTQSRGSSAPTRSYSAPGGGSSHQSQPQQTPRQFQQPAPQQRQYQQQAPQQRQYQQPAPQQRQYQQQAPQQRQYQQQTSQQRGYSPSNNSRPALNMRQPIVTPRSNQSNSGSNGGSNSSHGGGSHSGGGNQNGSGGRGGHKH